ncbi:NAD(+)--rifampin ADP-ribosyltransferase [Sphingobacterium sp.]|uniref:NAD(+)--rifampin ADP-ribosyltransferase n=1 Tax=Sphingobacterium sp. TaxID=341027 RepID=UPI0031D1A360
MKKAIENAEFALWLRQPPSDKGSFYRGTIADLTVGDLFLPGGESKTGSPQINHIYFTVMINGAGLAAPSKIIGAASD